MKNFVPIPTILDILNKVKSDQNSQKEKTDQILEISVVIRRICDNSSKNHTCTNRFMTTDLVQINSTIEDDLQVILLLSCFVGHPVYKLGSRL